MYITKANYKKILQKIDIKNLPDIQGEVYKTPIYFLSSWETKYLLIMKYSLMNPERFFVEVYKPIEKKEDTFRWVYESTQSSSYHSDLECERLNAIYKNFEVPEEIKERVEKDNIDKSAEEIDALVKQQITTFRNWFKTHFELFQNNTEEFLTKLDARWRIQRKIEEIEAANSGIANFDNLSLEELEHEMDNIIREAGRFFRKNEDKQSIIRRFQKLTFLAYKQEAITTNDTHLSDKELKDFLSEYDRKFKKPIQELLIQYYRVKYNPDLSFEGHLLDRLGFRPCGHCVSEPHTKQVEG